MRDRTDVRVFIRHEDYAYTAALYAIRYGWADQPQYLAIEDDGTNAWVKFEDGTPPEPFLRLNGHLGMSILRELAAAVSELGVKLPDEGKQAGILEAQTRHLEDLRKLVPGLA